MSAPSSAADDGPLRGDRRLGRQERALVGLAQRDADVAVLEAQLGEIGLLEDPDQALDALALGSVGPAVLARQVAVAPAQALEQRERALAEQRDQAELLLGRRERACRLARLLEREVGHVLGRRRLGDRARGLVDGPGGCPYSPSRSRRISSSTSVQRRAPSTCWIACVARIRPTGAAGGGDPHSSRTRRTSSSTSSSRSAAPSGARRRSTAATSPAGRDESAARSATWGDTGGAIAGGVADLRLDPACDLPADLAIESGLEPEAAQRLRQELGRRPLREHRHRVGRRGDRIGAGPRGLDRDRERGAAGALGVQADGHARGLAQASDQIAGGGRVERAGRVVQQHAVGAELGEAARALDEPSASRRVAVHEPGVHERAGLAHGGDRADEVVDVVQRVVQAEDVDPRLGGTQDEAAHEIGVGGARADEERAAQRHHERRRRARLERADPLPRALDGPLDGAREAAAAGDLERGVARAVEVLGEAQDARGRDAPDERLLRQEPDRRVDEASHVRAQARDR